jgi:ubiquinone/menaquinone biosynthesis C-methylase UbiE
MRRFLTASVSESDPGGSRTNERAVVTMTTDAETAKRTLRSEYDGAAPRYQQFIAPTFVPIGRRVVALARPNTDDVHLDLATGTGLIPALTDDRRIMSCIAPWRVALDFSSSMLRAARKAAPSTHLVQGDLDHLPFKDGSIDLLTLSLALHHLPTPRYALPELRRLLHPRGRLVLAAWGDELSPAWQAFDGWFEQAGLGQRTSPDSTDLPIDTVDRLRAALLGVGGFSAAEVSRDRPSIVFPTLEDFWEWRVSFAPTNRALSAVAPTDRERLRADCLATLRPQFGHGEVRADQAVLFAVARP